MGRRFVCRWLPAIYIVCLLASSHPAIGAEPLDRERTLLRTTTDSWSVGDRIRVTMSGPFPARWTGAFQGLESDSILLVRMSGAEAPARVGLSQIGVLEESIGRKRHWAAGAVIGLLAGAGVGALIGESHRSNPDDFIQGMDALYAPIGAAIGMGVGAGIGFMVRSDRWGIAAHFE